MEQLLIMIALGTFGIFLTGGLSLNDPNGVLSSGQVTQIQSQNPCSANKTIQIYVQKTDSSNPCPSFSPTSSPLSTPLPSPTTQPSVTGSVPVCNYDNGLTAVNSGQPFDSSCTCPEVLIECTSHHCSRVLNDSHWTCADIDNRMYWCNWPALTDQGNGVYCVGKPVIYLYPTTDTYVDVSLSIPGIITKSIPTYGVLGWQHVLAHPGGKLEYQGKTYHELFYESQIDRVNPPLNGIIIPKSQLEEKLASILFKLGLTEPESQEFIQYWVPKLVVLKGNYIVFSIFNPVTKQEVDQVNISPAPDTRIEFLAYFKPVEVPVILNPLILPETPPARIGFTEVEWGGTIDY